MPEKLNQMTDEEIARWTDELDELEPHCSTGKLGTPSEQKQKIDSLLARAKARKVNVNQLKTSG